jgi:uncharacterized membrane protein YphA (DoxX/SURF4 family)
MSERPGIIRRLDNTGVPLLVARVVLGLVFIFMGWNKVWDPVGFLKLIHEYEMTPNGAYVMLNLLAVTLPAIEVVCGVLLIAGVLIRGSALTLLLLLTMFTVVVLIRAIGIHNATSTPFCDIHFDCGCGGGDVYMCRKIPENIGLWLLTWVALFSRSRRFCLDGRAVGAADEPAGSGTVEPEAA